MKDKILPIVAVVVIVAIVSLVGLFIGGTIIFKTIRDHNVEIQIETNKSDDNNSTSNSTNDNQDSNTSENVKTLKKDSSKPWVYNADYGKDKAVKRERQEMKMT